MGDCNGRGAFTHTSYNDFEIVAANLLDDDPRKVSDRITTYALYIDPPLGRVGHDGRRGAQSGRKALVGKRPMTRVGRAVEKGETQGFMKVVVDAETEQILGAAMLGIGGDEVVHVDPRRDDRRSCPTRRSQRTMHIHPTVSELVPTMLAGPEAAGIAARPGISCRVTCATRHPRWRHVRTSEGWTSSEFASTSV